MLNERLRRIVRNEAHRQLLADEVRCGGMMREHFQRLHAFLFAVILELLAKHDLGSGLVHTIVEPEVSASLRALDAPAGKNLGEFRYILLGVTAVYAERVQLHDLSRVILIQSA